VSSGDVKSRKRLMRISLQRDSSGLGQRLGSRWLPTLVSAQCIVLGIKSTPGLSVPVPLARKEGIVLCTLLSLSRGLVRLATLPENADRKILVSEGRRKIVPTVVLRARRYQPDTFGG